MTPMKKKIELILEITTINNIFFFLWSFVCFSSLRVHRVREGRGCGWDKKRTSILYMVCLRRFWFFSSTSYISKSCTQHLVGHYSRSVVTDCDFDCDRTSFDSFIKYSRYFFSVLLLLVSLSSAFFSYMHLSLLFVSLFVHTLSTLQRRERE